MPPICTVGLRAEGAAFLYVREDRQAEIQPAVISHGNNRPRPGFTRFPRSFRLGGTFDPTAWLCVPEAIRFMGDLLPGGWRAPEREITDWLSKPENSVRTVRGASPCPE